MALFAFSSMSLWWLSPPTNISVLKVGIICGKDVCCSSMAIQVIGTMAEYSGHCSITNPPLLPIYLPPWGPTIINATCLLYWLPSVQQIIFDIANSFKAIFNQYQYLPKQCPKGLPSILSKLSPPFFASPVSPFLLVFHFSISHLFLMSVLNL